MAEEISRILTTARVLINAVGCRYNGLHHHMVLQPLHWLGQNINQGFNP